jgi:serine/threonine protein kinase
VFYPIRIYALELCQLSLHQLFHGEEAQKKYRDKMAPEKDVCLQLAKGLAHIHENQLIHRDLKPENVLIWVDSTGEKVVVKWADFGLSKQVNPRGSHSINGMRGTENWYSPEILKIFEEEGNDGKTSGKTMIRYNITTITSLKSLTSPNIRQRETVKSDVFSAGLVFGYYLLGGDHPFGSALNVLLNIVNNEPVNLKSTRTRRLACPKK